MNILVRVFQRSIWSPFCWSGIPRRGETEPQAIGWSTSKPAVQRGVSHLSPFPLTLARSSVPPLPPHPCILEVENSVILPGVGAGLVALIVVLICISLQTDDDVHLFTVMGPLAVFILSRMQGFYPFFLDLFLIHILR